MKQQVLIADLTRMRQDRVCVAGYTSDGLCVRPTLPYGNLTEPWLWEDGHLIVRPFALVELDLLTREPNPPHTEDWIINKSYKKSCGLMSEADRRSILLDSRDSSVAQIFGTEMHFKGFGGARRACWVRVGEGNRSLGTVGPVVAHHVEYGLNQYGKWDFRLSFSDETGQAYENMAVTDLAFREMLASLHQRDVDVEQAAAALKDLLRQAEVYLRIGLARPFQGGEECYLQVTGVYSFPDYLGGKSFNDFR